jgi:hypothetical protein
MCTVVCIGLFEFDGRLFYGSNSHHRYLYIHRQRKQHQADQPLSPSWDLHQAIHNELIKLPNIAIRHIKAHQDLSTPTAELSQEAKLNIEADKLAEEAYSSSTFSDQVPMIPGVSVQLLIDGKTIVSKHRVIAGDIRRTKAIKL